MHDIAYQMVVLHFGYNLPYIVSCGLLPIKICICCPFPVLYTLNITKCGIKYCAGVKQINVLLHWCLHKLSLYTSIITILYIRKYANATFAAQCKLNTTSWIERVLVTTFNNW